MLHGRPHETLCDPVPLHNPVKTPNPKPVNSRRAGSPSVDVNIHLAQAASLELPMLLMLELT
jgi:hypothetical protein